MSPSVVSVPRSLPQDPVLQRLLDNNEKWASAVQVMEPGFFDECAKGQAPKVLWIGCSDSRVPESVILGSKPGDIFVTRNIANQVHLHDDNILSVLAYAIAELGVQHVVIAGHSQCGGAAACLAAAGTAPSKPRSPLQRWLAPLTALATELSSNPGHKLTPLELVEANVLAQVSNVVNSDVVQDAWSADPAIRGKAKLVAVHGWVYDIEKGRVRDLGASVYNQ